MLKLTMIAISAMLLLALGIVFFVILFQRRVIRHQQELKKINEQQQQELLTASIAGEEKERMRIAGELHDDVGATLSSVKLFLHTAATTGDPLIIRQSRELLEDSIQKIRDISHKLQPATLHHLGLKASLESFIDTINKSGRLKIDYTIPKLEGMDEHVELAIYRIVQELISNMIKHASAHSIVMEVFIAPSQFELLLAYNGNGLSNEQYRELIHKKGGIGLKNIENRLQSVAGTIRFAKKEAGRNDIRITIPLKK